MAARARPCALAPGEEIADGTGVGPAGVGIADGGGEELDEAAGGVVARVGDDGGQDRAAGGLGYIFIILKLQVYIHLIIIKYYYCTKINICSDIIFPSPFGEGNW